MFKALLPLSALATSVPLDINNFDQLVTSATDTNTAWMIKFYTPTCPFCQ